jgi:D-beta-D-heptose 7-phosphate kinase/D-beta-D-heptose 1-phosphate adenosyltransferase
MDLFLPQYQHLNKINKETILYHDIFSYPLKKDELVKWRAGFSSKKKVKTSSKKGFHFREGREAIISQRFLREKISKEKLKIAKRASKLIGKLPTVKMVGVTGSLAMMNADENSDIDLMIITKNGSLWTTRLLVYGLLKINGFDLRKAGSSIEKNKLCLNMWLDERDLKIKKRNIYSAHEIAQIRLLLNKNKTYERLLSENEWVLKYWPNAVRIMKVSENNDSGLSFGILEKLAFWLQYRKMRNKITREVVTSTRAFFHPFDWGREISHLLTSKQ